MSEFFPKNDLQLKKAFDNIISKGEFRDYIKEISLLIYDSNLDRQNLEKILNEHEIVQIEDIKEDILDMLISYVNFILYDNVIKEEEGKNLKQLKRFFRIKEGDFFIYRRKQIQDILNKQFERIYADNKIETGEALYKVELQELFDLSYDQFLELVDKEVNASLTRGANPEDLDTVIMKSYQNKKHLSKKSKIKIFHIISSFLKNLKKYVSKI